MPLSMRDMMQQRYTGLTLVQPYRDFLGHIWPGFQILIWGEKGSGKSTQMLLLAVSLVPHAIARNGTVMYLSAEEGIGPGLQRRVERVGADEEALLDHLVIEEWRGSISDLKDTIKAHDVRWIVVDSVSIVDPASKSARNFSEWARENEVGVIYVAHAYKDGKDYKGDSKLGHEVDAVIRAYKTDDRRYMLESQKSRALDSPPDDIEAPSSIKALHSPPSLETLQREHPRENGMCTNWGEKPKKIQRQCKAIFAKLHDSGAYDEDLADDDAEEEAADAPEETADTNEESADDESEESADDAPQTVTAKIDQAMEMLQNMIQ
ncbi:gp40 [Salisaeta icosahedral phage 1]|uniref:ATPase n=1 Tax=Salisaeta icosahedral phage 1 TaxID=1183239 RepID=UPI00025EA935|nr:ATPase [Salisaeta icosahedral phage 1]AFJ21495.1 gp40 [Salisaeta icosahedral phage 1]